MRFKKTQNKQEDTNAIVGDAHKTVNSADDSKPKRFITKQKIAIIFITLLLISCLAAASYVYYQDSEPKESTVDAQGKQRLDATRERVAQGLPDNPNPQQTNEYYASALWLKIRDGDNQGVADQYLNEIKPLNLSLSTDLKEGIAAALITVKNNQEAKLLVASILTDYKNTPSSSDPFMNNYIQAKIDKYTSLEQNL